MEEEGAEGRTGELSTWKDRLPDRTPELAANCCISALALLLLSFRNSDVFLRLSASLVRLWCLLLARLRLAI